METLRKSKRNARNKKKTVTEIKNAFNGLICRLDITKERFSDTEDTLT